MAFEPAILCTKRTYAAVNWLSPSRCRWSRVSCGDLCRRQKRCLSRQARFQMQAVREQEETGSIAKRSKRSERHITSAASNKVPGPRPKSLISVAGRVLIFLTDGVTGSSPVFAVWQLQLDRFFVFLPKNRARCARRCRTASGAGS